MVVPLAARWVAAADRAVFTAYRTATRRVRSYPRRDRMLATQAAVALVSQLVAWLALFLAGYTLILWPVHGRSITGAFIEAGSSLFTLGFAEPPGTTPDAAIFVAAATGMIVSTSRSAGTRPTRGPSSSAGGSTTRPRPT
jgi:hypothetical protein